MTRQRQFGEEDPWRTWVRQQPLLDSCSQGLAFTDSDLWIHRYLDHCDKVGSREVQHIMLLEVKTRAGRCTDSQADTYHLIRQILDRADRANRYYKRPKGRGLRYVRCWGVHELRMSGTTPDDSAWMTWDGKQITVEQLAKLLRFELSPRTLAIHKDRRHHRPSLAKRLQTKLRIEGEDEE